MRSLIIALFLTSTAFAAAPNYSQNPQLAVGRYSAVETVDCRDGLSECEAAEIFMKNGKPFIRVGEFFEYSEDRRVLPLQKTASGALVFKGSYNDDCDNNGCANVDEIQGVVSPKAEGSRFVPQVKVTIKISCGWGDEEACPSESEETYVIRMRR